MEFIIMNCQKGPGLKFKKEVRCSIERIRNYPHTWPFEKKEVRKYLLHHFPYKILYAIQGNYIIILALAHQHRKPDYWDGESES